MSSVDPGMVAPMWPLIESTLSQPLLLSGMVLTALGAAVIAERSITTPSDSIQTQQTEVRASQGKRALIVGAGTVGQALAAMLEMDGRYEVMGFLDDQPAMERASGWPILGGRDEALSIAREFSIDEIFVAYAPTWQQQLAEQLAATMPDVRLCVVPSPYEATMQLGCVENAGDIALVRLVSETRRGRESLKRTVDLAFALAGLVVLSPLIAFVAVCVKMTSKGPVIFAQERVGRYGKPFILYKFRTMVTDAEARTGPVLAKGEEDPRLTGFGRWIRLVRIDEIPQLWNVLRGEMSLVGPRPERPHFVQLFEQAVPSYAKRHQVRPGITGLAQVCGSYHTDARDKLRFDLVYASQQSFLLDMSILLRTVLVVCFPRRKKRS